MARQSHTLRVRAREGVRFPEQGRPRRYITHEEPRLVRASVYYRKAIADGDLMLDVEPPPPPRSARGATVPASTSTPPRKGEE